MFATNKNKLTVLLVLGVFAAFGIAASNPGHPGEGFVNLQVLPKDITHEQLDAVMHSFNDALGVKCMFCHVHEGEDFRKGWDFAKDDKPEKDIARSMMRMTTAINTNYFNFDNSTKPDTIGVIKCMTCHRGSPHPDQEGMPGGGVRGQEGVPPPPPPPPKN